MATLAHPRRWSRRSLLGWLAASALLTARASTLPAPTGPVVLTIRGRIERRNQGSHAALDLAMLEALPQHHLLTRTPWDSEPVTFSGPRLRDVLDAVGAHGQRLRAVALDDYRVIIPLEDAQRYDVIVATRKNGARMSVRQKGPLFIVYPFDHAPQLRDRRYYERSIWQLKALEVE
ncbi:hypothetical protein Talka_02155 [Tepidimonas alkaliphilus]|uniref:Oxidoreductase molybdopterin-binding domain-containing protein n=1 Tax=Tepidimonas alkaliphilus TaxID=2588942 RepID=A0A554W499_9BURK|nr:molybdopterin-dependent oxidoreductase [Tepidimonas alkaliphilus]TSE18409.1 hypothetical protein Talka_02155 [Tepidimonas alkaliphilus]